MTIGKTSMPWVAWVTGRHGPCGTTLTARTIVDDALASREKKEIKQGGNRGNDDVRFGA
jgi:hypothetical protein